MTSKNISLKDARHLALCAQALDGSASSTTEAVTRAGFVRTLGGAESYLAIRARSDSDLSRATVDASLVAGDLMVAPSVRGCIYLVPKAELPWSIACADVLSRNRRRREYSKVGLTETEIRKLGDKLMAVLEAGPLTTAELRAALPSKAVRSFGDVGKKIGITTALPPVLRELEFRGSIERRIRDGRLDSEVYCWQRTSDSGLVDLHQIDDLEAAAAERIAQIYLSSWPLASIDGFAHWSGFGKRLARSAFEALATDFELVDISVEGFGEFVSAQSHLDRAAARDRKSLRERVIFLPFLDSAFHLARGPGFFADANHHHLEIPKRGMTKASSLGGASHLGLRSVLLGDQLVGFWEYDPEARAVATGIFGTNAKPDLKLIDAAAATVGRFLSEDLGHGRSFSLDTEKDQRRRVVWFSEISKL